MCSVMAGIGAALSLFGGYASYESQRQQIQAQADSQASMYRAQAQAAEYNAKLEEQNARVEARKQEQIAENYGAEQRRLRARHRLAEGQLRAGMGAAGLDSSSGSGLDILASGQEAYWQDQMTLLSNQRNDNYSSRVQQSNYMRAAENQRANAESSRVAANNVLADADRQIGALGMNTILGTAASIVPFFGGGSGSSSGKTVSGHLYSAKPTSIAGNILGWANTSPTILPGMNRGKGFSFG